MSSPSTIRAPTTAGIHWVCPLDRISTLPTTRLSSALGALGWAAAGAGTATRRKPPAKDAIMNWNERRLGELPIFSTSPRTRLDPSTCSDLEGRAFRSRNQRETHIARGPSRGVYAVEHDIVVGRIVVERNQSPGPAQRGERERVSHRTMPPSNALLVLLGGVLCVMDQQVRIRDRKSTRLNSSHSSISYAVFCL